MTSNILLQGSDHCSAALLTDYVSLLLIFCCFCDYCVCVSKNCQALVLILIIIQMQPPIHPLLFKCGIIAVFPFWIINQSKDICHIYDVKVNRRFYISFL